MFLIFIIISLAALLGIAYLLHREIRRSPGPMAWGQTPHWAKRFRVTSVALVLLIACVIFYAFLVEPNRLVTKEETIAIANWPKELDGLSIAVLSDIHVGGWCIDDDKLRLIIERTNE